MPHKKRFEELLKKENVAAKIGEVVKKIKTAHTSGEMDSCIASKFDAIQGIDETKKADARKKLGEFLKALSEGMNSHAVGQQIAMTLGEEKLKHVTEDEIIKSAEAISENYTPEKMSVFIDRYIEMILGNDENGQNGQPKGKGRADNGAPPDVEGLKAELARQKAAADDYMNSLVRMKADFDNYKKRVIREKEEYKALAFERFFTDLLTTLDCFDAIKPDSKLDYDGIQKIGKLLYTTMSKYAMTEIDTAVPFDANVHQALTTEERTDVAENTILETIRKGYRLGERVIRPALVKVAVAGSGGAEAANETEKA